MKKILFVLSSAAVLIVAGCSKGEIASASGEYSSSETEISEAYVPVDAVPGVLTVKFNEVPAGLSAIQKILPELHVTAASPTFPDDPRFTRRHHEAGLDLWYNVNFDERALMTKAAATALSKDAVQHIDYVVSTVSNSALPFNDPLLSSQWHYYNDGTRELQTIQFVEGADINLFTAWPIESGSENVIVAIIDSGIKYDHEDLKDAMWINQAEYNGTAGVDDDGNGLVDDIYGYNFCTVDGSTMVGTIKPEDHGTHTAGTVGAVNNNGVGLCGIAGGNGSHRGVRLMSVQINMDGMKGAYIGSAFVYAADNGAVISNNSWGFTDTEYRSESFEDALKYFVNYAGTDQDGNQTGPIKGGVICFSAGNEASRDSRYPGNLDYVVCVAASSPDNKVASYSNYGSWVDITAPGGDQNRMGTKGGVYSTTAGSTSSYDLYQGTSMACPHVTGVCALIASHFQEQGFTCDNVVDILYSTASDEIYDYNPGLRAKKELGAGLVDATAAVSTGSDVPAGIETIAEPKVKSNTVTIGWTVPQVKGKAAFPAYVNINLAPKNSSEFEVTKVQTSVESGSVQEYVFEDLEFNTEYKFYFVTESTAGVKSEASELKYFRTGMNSKPVITPLSGTSLTLKGCGEGSLSFKITDNDGHEIKTSLRGDTNGASIIKDSDEQYSVHFNAVKMETGIHNVELIASDGYEEVGQAISCTVRENHAPVVVKTISDIVFNGTGGSMDYKLNELFQDPDGDQLSYKVTVTQDKNIIESSQTDDVLTITSRSYGYASFEVTASDPKGASVSMQVKVLVRDGSREVDLYPVPMTDKLNVRAGQDKSGSIRILNPAGAEVIEQDIAFGPFKPQAIDVSALGVGTYTVIIKSDGTEYRQTVAKE